MESDHFLNPARSSVESYGPRQNGAASMQWLPLMPLTHWEVRPDRALSAHLAGFQLGVGLELSDSRGLVKSQDTFDVGRCQTVRRREVGMPRIGV